MASNFVMSCMTSFVFVQFIGLYHELYDVIPLCAVQWPVKVYFMASNFVMSCHMTSVLCVQFIGLHHE